MRKILFIIAMILLFILVGWIAFPELHGAEVPGVIPNDFGGAVEAHWIWALLASPVAVGFLTWLGKTLDDWIRSRKVMREYDELRDLYDFAAYGADNSYFNLVRRLKHANADGKLTEDEKNQAMNLAIKEAVAYARENGIDLIKSVGPNMLRRLIEQVLADRKAGRYVTGPLAPLPELQPLMQSGSRSDKQESTIAACG